MFAPSSSETWVGCGNGAGLWLSADAGDSFDRGHPSEDLYVFDIKKDASGRVLACGHDYDGANDGVLLWRQDGWTGRACCPTETTTPRATSSTCRTADRSPSTLTAAFVISNTSGDLTVSNDGGATWSKEDRYCEVNLDGGPQAYQMMQVVSTADGVFGSGYNIAQPPTFFAPSSNPDARWYNLAATVVDSGVDGEGWPSPPPMAVTPGSADATSRPPPGPVASSHLHRWRRVLVKPHARRRDRHPSRHRLRRCGRQRNRVGDRYPPNSLGGFALLTTDGGHLDRLDEELPADLQRAAVVDGEYLIGGNGYLARGTF